MKYNILAIKLALWVKSPKDNSYLALLITIISLKLVLTGIILLHAHSQVVYGMRVKFHKCQFIH